MTWYVSFTELSVSQSWIIEALTFIYLWRLVHDLWWRFILSKACFSMKYYRLVEAHYGLSFRFSKDAWHMRMAYLSSGKTSTVHDFNLHTIPRWVNELNPRSNVYEMPVCNNRGRFSCLSHSRLHAATQLSDRQTLGLLFTLSLIWRIFSPYSNP